MQYATKTHPCAQFRTHSAPFRKSLQPSRAFRKERALSRVRKFQFAIRDAGVRPPKWCRAGVFFRPLAPPLNLKLPQPNNRAPHCLKRRCLTVYAAQVLGHLVYRSDVVGSTLAYSKCGHRAGQERAAFAEGSAGGFSPAAAHATLPPEAHDSQGPKAVCNVAC